MKITDSRTILGGDCFLVIKNQEEMDIGFYKVHLIEAIVENDSIGTLIDNDMAIAEVGIKRYSYKLTIDNEDGNIFQYLKRTIEIKNLTFRLAYNDCRNFLDFYNCKILNVSMDWDKTVQLEFISESHKLTDAFPEKEEKIPIKKFKRKITL